MLQVLLPWLGQQLQQVLRLWLLLVLALPVSLQEGMMRTSGCRCVMNRVCWIGRKWYVRDVTSSKELPRGPHHLHPSCNNRPLLVQWGVYAMTLHKRQLMHLDDTNH